jgi:hypothetical protein
VDPNPTNILRAHERGTHMLEPVTRRSRSPRYQIKKLNWVAKGVTLIWQAGQREYRQNRYLLLYLRPAGPYFLIVIYDRQHLLCNKGSHARRKNKPIALIHALSPFASHACAFFDYYFVDMFHVYTMDQNTCSATEWDLIIWKIIKFFFFCVKNNKILKNDNLCSALKFVKYTIFFIAARGNNFWQ